MGQWMTGRRETLAVAGRLSLLTLLVVALALPAVIRPAVAQSGGDYDLTWRNTDAAGWTFSTGVGYVLGGTAGQSDAGLLRGGDYSLVGGFWGYAATVTYQTYLPLVLRNN